MKKCLILSIVLLVISNVFWAYNFFDLAVTKTYENDDLNRLKKNHQQLVRLANLQVIGKDTATVVDLIGKDTYGLAPFIKENCIYSADICLSIKDNKVFEFK